MKQLSLQGVRPAHVTAAVAPINMPDEVVTLCETEADAVTHSINFAKARFGFTQLQIAQRCGWRGDSFLSEIARGEKTMPERREQLFAVATGCNLLEQVKHRQRIVDRMHGKETKNEREKAVVARMLAVAEVDRRAA